MSDIPRWRRAGRALAAWPLLGAILACGAGRDHEPTPPDQVTVVTEPAPAGEVVAEPAPVPDERLGALYFELSGALFEASCEVDDACIGDAPIADEAFRECVIEGVPEQPALRGYVQCAVRSLQTGMSCVSGPSPQGCFDAHEARESACYAAHREGGEAFDECGEWG